MIYSDRLNRMRFGLKEKHITLINEVFRNHDKIKEAILYGSRAIGNYGAGSDIDLVLLTDSITYSELKKIESQIDDLMLPYSVDLSDKSSIDNKDLLEHIARVGKSFYVKA